MSTIVRKAVFPVAGLGSRFLPATKANPKEMLNIVDKPLIQYAVEEAIASGITELIFVTNSNKRAIEDHFDTDLTLNQRLEQAGKADLLSIVENILPEGVSCVYIRQPQPKGLGHAIWCARHVVGHEPFAVLLADDLIDSGEHTCLQKMLSVHQLTGAGVLAVEQIAPEHVDKYGIVELDTGDSAIPAIKRIVEKPAVGQITSTLAAVGRYILTPGIFEHLGKTAPGAGGEIQLTDAIASQLMQEKLYIHRLSGVRYDCGSKMGYLKATIEYGLKHPSLGEPLRDYLKQLFKS